jgi:putative zinc finger protein/HEAT repeat protein
MNCKDIQAKLIDYLDQGLAADAMEAIRDHLDSCAECRREAEELQELLTAMKVNTPEIPPAELRERFDILLQSELNFLVTNNIIQEFPSADNPGKPAAKTVRFSSSAWRVAASVLLLVSGIGIGVVLHSRLQPPVAPDQIAALRQEVKEMKEEVLFNLINDESASQRIKAVGYAESMPSPDQPVVDALINTLNHDKSVNVRLAALYSLSRFADHHNVRDSLVASLGMQTEPIIQVVLINLLAEKRETRAIAPIRNILTNKKTIKEVRDAAQRGLRSL